MYLKSSSLPASSNKQSLHQNWSVTLRTSTYVFLGFVLGTDSSTNVLRVFSDWLCIFRHIEEVLYPVTNHSCYLSLWFVFTVHAFIMGTVNRKVGSIQVLCFLSTFPLLFTPLLLHESMALSLFSPLTTSSCSVCLPVIIINSGKTNGDDVTFGCSKKSGFFSEKKSN